MPKFKDLNSLEAYLQKNIHQVLNRSGELERVLTEAMVQSVYDIVYSAYQPEGYERRMEEDGLADPRNASITSVTIEDGVVKLVFENLTQGQDSLKGQFTTDTIVEGIESNWNATGEWSEPRDFISETTRKLQSNPSEWIQAIKSGLSAKGIICK